MFMGLCTNTLDWPNTLAKLGYEVQLIEQSISLQSTRKVSPDVVAVSNRMLHAIAADCKGGNNLDPEQDQKYQHLTSKDLLRHVTVYDRRRMLHSVCYVDTEVNHNRLEPHTQFPFITFGKDCIVVSGSFGHKNLDKNFTGVIPLKNAREPTFLYPFSHDDEDSVVIEYVLHAIIECFVKPPSGQFKIDGPGAPEAILSIVHKHTNLISAKHKKELVSRIDGIVKMLLEENPALRDQLSKIDEARNPSVMNRLRRMCEDLNNKYKTQTRLDRF